MIRVKRFEFRDENSRAAEDAERDVADWIAENMESIRRVISINQQYEGGQMESITVWFEDKL